jgi:deoxyribonuclease V
MRVNQCHSWNVTPAEAIRLQQALTSTIQLRPIPGNIRLIAGADVSYNLGSDQVYAGVVVLQLPELDLVEEAVAIGKATFPYIPGLLSFREAPILLQALQTVNIVPDVVMIDGQGIAHPRGIGIASHVGLFLDMPTIGCAKSRLTGEYDARALPNTAGSSLLLRTKEGAIIGAVVRTKNHTQPVFVSPGFKADLPSSVKLVLTCCRGYKLPEPTRLAHQLVNRVRREHSEAKGNTQNVQRKIARLACENMG